MIAMKEFTVLSPTRVSLYTYADNKKNQALNRVGKDKFFNLNLNEYRNAHYRILDQSKKIYHEVMYRTLVAAEAHYLKLEQIAIFYQLIVCNKRKIDTMNVVAIVDKYFQDVLVNMGIIPEDSYKVTIRFEVLPVVFSKGFTENVCKITVVECSTQGQLL